jgi:putative membrane-bound dehydrogenase-like protein
MVSLAALADRKPAKLAWGVGSVGFANNRRTSGGPTDHDLPVLVVKDVQGKVRAIWTSYACHCVTLSNNKISGDWAGYAQEAIQDDFPGSIALVSIGCGADQNPNSGVTGDKADIAQRQGMELAKEVKRLAGGFLVPLSGRIICASEQFALPLGSLPTKEEWETRAKRTDAIGHHARVQLDRLARGEALKTEIPYRVQSIRFGDRLAIVYLPGEVVVDYSLRLKSELDRSRLWVNAYANACPCYIPSERILREGGYEGGGAMTYYDLPAPLKTGVEERIITAVHRQLGQHFGSPIDPKKMGGTKPVSPQQSLSLIRVDKNLSVELVAAEPLVTSPVAIDWGVDGKLYVAEMFDYPEGVPSAQTPSPPAPFSQRGEGGRQPGGRIKVLEDVDGDWRYDRATVFLENIPFPTGVTAYRKGVLVCAAPDILYAEDSDGDGRADIVQKLFSGFGTHNYQGRVNSLEYGLDGWIYGSCGLFGGKITCSPLSRVSEPPALAGGEGRTVNLGDRDFRINPDEGLLEPATGRTQQGRVRDDWGNWFGCDSGQLGRHYPLMDHYLRRNPHYAATDTVVHVPQSQKLFPLNPQLQLFKLSGPAGVPTAACGLGIYRDDRLGPDFTGNAFVCEPVNLLVTRMKLEPRGSTFTGVRAQEEQGRDFLASTDPWFRPVQARTGPDGCLWIVDMYRHVIEHPRWIPPEELAKLDLRAGSTLGRIYRVRRAGDQDREMPRLAKGNAIGWVGALDTPNGWQRDMATHLLTTAAEKTEAVVEALRKLAEDSQCPLTRLHALVVLDQLGELSNQSLQRALRDRDPGVRRIAVRLCEKKGGARLPFVATLTEIVRDPDPQVRLQLACTLGQWQDETAAALLGRLLITNAGDPYLVAAAMSSLHGRNVRAVLQAVASSSPPRLSLLRPLLRTAIRLGQDEDWQRVLPSLIPGDNGELRPDDCRVYAIVLDELALARRKPQEVLAEGIWRHFTQLHLNVRARVKAAVDEDKPIPDLALLELLGRVEDRLMRADDVHLLAVLLRPKHGTQVHAAAFAALSRVPGDIVIAELVREWKQLTPSLKSQVLDLALAREGGPLILLTSLEGRAVPVAEVDAARRQRLLASPTQSIRTRAAQLFDGPVNADRQKIIEAHADVGRLTGDAVRGKQVFARTCATCHRLDNVGHDIGPDLRALGGKTPQFFLQEILDPSRNMDTRYVEYVVLTKAGRTLSGLLATETATSITLRGQEGKQEVLLRSDIEELRSSGKSLMPEGLEKDLTKQDLADAIAFVMSVNAPRSDSLTSPRQFVGNRPEVVRLVNGRLALLATQAEIHGNEIMFEEPFKNLGMWHGENDRACWTIELATPGEFDVWLDWSCDDRSARNPFVVEGGTLPLRGRVEGTGGWDRYRQQKIGTIQLPTGRRRITLRPDGVKPQWALMDLRGVHLVPKGEPLALQSKESRTDAAASADEIARQILDDKLSAERRQDLIKQHAKLSAELIRHLAAGVESDAKEEYRRIPWIWRVAVAAGRRDVVEELHRILEVSLPKENKPLRDWQAVVIGGGIINGISLNGTWPGERIRALLKDQGTLAKRWEAILQPSATMADNEKTPTGTRYDALRIIALDSWDKSGDRLKKYLAKGTHDELTMGAISGLSDVDRPEIAKLLLSNLGHFSAGNRKLAMEALVRTEQRALELLDAFEAGTANKGWLTPEVSLSLGRHKSERVRERTAKVFPPRPGT